MTEPTVLVTLRQLDSYARRVERETLQRYGSSLTFTSISNNVGHMIVEIVDDHMAEVRCGWQRRMRQEARKYVATSGA